MRAVPVVAELTGPGAVAAPVRSPVVIDIEQEGSVAVVRWRDGENRFNRASVDRWHQVVYELEAVDGPLAVVVVGEERFAGA